MIRYLVAFGTCSGVCLCSSDCRYRTDLGRRHPANARSPTWTPFQVSGKLREEVAGTAVVGQDEDGHPEGLEPLLLGRRVAITCIQGVSYLCLNFEVSL